MYRDDLKARELVPLGGTFSLRVPVAVTVVLIFALAAAVSSWYGLGGGLSRDGAIYLYSGQRMAEGVPPYVSVFDHKGPLAPMLAGAGVMLSKLLDSNDIMTVRVIFYLMGCLAVVSAYLLGSSLFKSQRAGVFAALTFLAFFCFARYATAEPEAKTPMLMFEVLALLFTSQKRWFWAGLCGSLAFLVWQPMVVFPLVTLFLAATQPGGPRSSALSRAISGAGLPVALTVAYFYIEGALYELINGSILFNLRYLDQEKVSSVAPRLIAPVRALFLGYTTIAIPVVICAMLAAVVIGSVTLGRLYFPKGPAHVSLGKVAARETFAPILLSLPFPVVWSMMDFQGYPDFFVFIPYVAVGFGGFLYFVTERIETADGAGSGGVRNAFVPITFALLTAIAVISSMITIHLRTEISSLDTAGRGPRPGDFTYQKRAAAEIRESFGEDARVVSIGVPQVLVLLHDTNPNPYAFVIRGIDREIAYQTPGGFHGWLRELGAYDPDMIAFGPTSGHYKPKLMDWLTSHYQRQQIGPWIVFVKEGYPTQARIQLQHPPRRAANI
ncbi:MAG: glycosyltransferase family 39 protein [Actinomycetota bacterium]|nr:glycosyltransferase family 39 protein [Actinomycetota bacterium]